MGFGLSTWMVPDTLDRRGDVRTPWDLIRVWNYTLYHIASNGLLGRVLWVDVLNEFPIVGQWAPGIWQTVFRVPWPNNVFLQNALQGAMLVLPWTVGGILERANSFLTEVIPVLRQGFPEVNYTFSFQGNSLSASNIQRLTTRSFDIAELHIWLSDDLLFLVESGETAMFSGPYPQNLQRFAPRATKLYASKRDQWLQKLAAHIDSWHRWAESQNLPVITTEAWGPINYDDVPGDTNHSYWGWVKDVGEYGLRHALCRGWIGSTTSNFAEPHFVGMWADVDWHKRQTSLIEHYQSQNCSCDTHLGGSQLLII